jgi:hypothetical protein
MWLAGDQPVKRPAGEARSRLAEDHVRAELSHRRQLLITVTRNHERFMRVGGDLEEDTIRGSRESCHAFKM